MPATRPIIDRRQAVDTMERSRQHSAYGVVDVESDDAKRLLERYPNAIELSRWWGDWHLGCGRVELRWQDPHPGYNVVDMLLVNYYSRNIPIGKDDRWMEFIWINEVYHPVIEQLRDGMANLRAHMAPQAPEDEIREGE